jgi:hypothetical protein
MPKYTEVQVVWARYARNERKEVGVQAAPWGAPRLLGPLRRRRGRLDAGDDHLELIERDLRVAVRVGERKHAVDGVVVGVGVDLLDRRLELGPVDVAALRRRTWRDA